MDAGDYCRPVLGKVRDLREETKAGRLSKAEFARERADCEAAARAAIRGCRQEHPRGAGANLARFIVYRSPDDPEAFKPWLYLAHILVQEIPQARTQFEDWYRQITAQQFELTTRDPLAQTSAEL